MSHKIAFMADQKDAGVRVTASRAAALAAAQTLLQQEGLAAVTHQRVAAEAGVGRATVYRHWPKPEALLHEAMGRVEMPFFTDFDDDLRRWLLETCGDWPTSSPCPISGG